MNAMHTVSLSLSDSITPLTPTPLPVVNFILRSLLDSSPTPFPHPSTYLDLDTSPGHSDSGHPLSFTPYPFKASSSPPAHFHPSTQLFTLYSLTSILSHSFNISTPPSAHLFIPLRPLRTHLITSPSPRTPSTHLCAIYPLTTTHPRRPFIFTPSFILRSNFGLPLCIPLLLISSPFIHLHSSLRPYSLLTSSPSTLFGSLQGDGGGGNVERFCWVVAHHIGTHES